MPFETKTLEELVQIEKDEYRERLEEGDLSEGSDYDIEARVHAIPIFGNQAHALYIANQILPDKADIAHLERHANLRGVPKRRAAPAAGRIHVGLDGGAPPLVQPSGSEVTTLAGQSYVLDEDAVVALPAWSGKTVRLGATLSRVQVNPDVTGMARGQRVTLTVDGNGYDRSIVRVLPSIQAIEVSPILPGEPTAGGTIVPVASGWALATSASSGTSSNQEPGDEGTLEAPTAGLLSGVEFVEMTGGADDELVDELRRDVLSVMAVRPGSGNMEQWRRWVKATPGVGVLEAFVYPNLRGLGTLTLLPFGPPESRQIGEERNAEIVAWLRSQAAFDDDIEVLQFSWLGLPQDFELVVTPGSGYEPDVEMESGSLALSASVACTVGTLQLQLEADLARIQVGDRVVVPITVDGFPTTEEVPVQSVINAGVGDYRLVLEEDLSAAPALSESLYSGGPLYAPIVSALEEYFETLGPGDTVPASRWPASIDTFQGDVIVSEVVRRTKGVAGARDLVVSAPSANVLTPPLFVQRLGQVRITWSS